MLIAININVRIIIKSLTKHIKRNLMLNRQLSEG